MFCSPITAGATRLWVAEPGPSLPLRPLQPLQPPEEEGGFLVLFCSVNLLILIEYVLEQISVYRKIVQKVPSSHIPHLSLHSFPSD